MLKLNSKLNLTLATLFVALFLVSCSKDDLVGPCGGHEQTEADVAGAKNASDQGISSSGGNASNSSGSSSGSSDGEGDGISDDGDDLSDTEKRKKR